MRRLALLLSMVLLPAPAWAVQDVVNTLHNLSTSGTGAFTSANITQVCVFCHTPHNAAPDAPLWNRQMSGATYPSVYDSTTLQSTPGPGQPSGKSRLCLACHDGTVALGAFVNPPNDVVNDLSGTFLTGRANLDTDLSDDHPISFNYASGLNEMVNPAAIDLPLESGDLQCTSCHDPHEKDLQPFLHKTTLNGDLCTTCHARAGASWDWATSSHATSTATPSASTPWPERKPAWRGANVAENACLNCHTPHNAATPPRLLKGDALNNTEENACYLCHDGSVTTHVPGRNIEADFLKAYRHTVDTTPNPNHDATQVEDVLTMPLHVECVDCHNPHGVQDAPPMISFDPSNPSDPNHSTPPNANIRIQGVSGLDINGSPTTDITYQYELCFKCHGLPGKSACDTQRCSTATTRQMVRLDGVYNIRDKVYSATPGLISWHPIESNNPANNSEVPSLRLDVPQNTTTTLLYCTDCHNSDGSPAAGLNGAIGPHGSNNPFMLAQTYNTIPELAYVASNYDLCFKCHSEANLIQTPLSGFSHDRHVDGRNKSCVNCHDPHGSHATPHLLNFLISSDGGTYLIEDADGGGVRWVDLGTYSGECYMNCHGTRHNPRGY